MLDKSKKIAKVSHDKQGMSQCDICRELGLDRAYISNVENGK